MSNRERNNFKVAAKPDQTHYSGSIKEKERELFVANLPPDITEEGIAFLFKEFSLQSIRIRQLSPFSRFAFIGLASSEAMQQAIKQLHGCVVKGRRIAVAVSEDRRGPEGPRSNKKMPGLEAAPAEEPGLPSGPVKTKESDIFVGNLPPDIEKDFSLLALQKRQLLPSHSFACVGFSSPQARQPAIQQVCGNMVKGEQVTVKVSSEDSMVSKTPRNSKEMPGLEPISVEELKLNNGPTAAAPLTMPDLSKLVAKYVVPTEMRASFLIFVLNDCFKNLRWLANVSKVRGEATLLVTDTMPQSPYFWAVHFTKEHQQRMQLLFATLAKVAFQQPFLASKEVQRGTRCLAECSLGDEGAAWHRCWVVDKVQDWAVVFFVDLGISATTSLNFLRKLDKDEFWETEPLAQPFMLQEGELGHNVMIRKVLQGRVTASVQNMPHLLQFLAQKVY